MDARSTTALLYLDGVTVSFDGFRALNNLSFPLEPGEMRAIIGPNGAGKTTMMDVVTGKTRPDAGEVYFDGSYDLSRLDETEIALLGIGRKFQKPTVFDMHTVEDNIGLALKGDRRARKTLFWRESEEEASRINRILEIIRLSPVRQRGAGVAQRVALRRARQGDLRAGAQRRRQDEPPRRARRTASGQQGCDHVRRRRHYLAQAQRAGAAGHRLRAAGA